VADSPENPQKPDWGILKLLGAIVLVGGFVALLLFSSGLRHGSIASLRNRGRAGVVALACQKHAKEHGGKFPPSLMAVGPLMEESSDKWQYCDPGSKRLYDWLYFPGATTADGAKRLILASPTASTNKDQSKSERIVAFADAHAEVWPESQYQDFLKHVATDAK
jgi:hypothetical protein